MVALQNLSTCKEVKIYSIHVYGNKQHSYAYDYFIVELSLHILKFVNDFKIVILYIPCHMNFMWQELYSSTIRNTIKVEAKLVEWKYHRVHKKWVKSLIWSQ